jgi:hypothetical protein
MDWKLDLKKFSLARMDYKSRIDSLENSANSLLIVSSVNSLRRSRWIKGQKLFH